MISIQIDTGPIVRALEGSTKQIPFAIASALTATAKAGQAEIVDTLGEDMTIRNGWTAKGIRIEPARKDKLEAAVGSRDRFMALQALGGEREGKDGHAQAIPVGIRPTPQALTPRSKWPGKMLQKRAVFMAKTHSGRLGIWRRTGKAGYPIALLYWIQRGAVHVKARWHLAERFGATAAKVWPGLATAAIERAVADEARKAGAKA